MSGTGHHADQKAQVLYLALGGQASDEECLELLHRNYFGVHETAPATKIDVLLIDTRGLLSICDEHLIFLKDLRQTHAEASFLFIADIDLPFSSRKALKRFGVISATGDSPDLMIDRLDALVESLALADECGERIKTLASLKQKPAAKLALKSRTDNLRVLIAGSPSPLMLRILRSLQKQPFQISAALSVKQAISYIETTFFDCLILLPGVEHARYTSMIKLLRRNNRTKEMPVLVIPDIAEHDNLDMFGKKFLTQGADLIVADHDAENGLMSEVTQFSKRRRLTRSMKQFLRKSATQEKSVALRMCDIPFFENHLARQCQSSSRSRKSLCLSAYRVKTRSGAPLKSRHFKQAATYASAILRDIDLMTSLSDEIMLVSHPACNFVEAERQRKQIVRLIQDIKFRHGKTDDTELLIVESSAVRFDGEELPERLITRAFQTISQVDADELRPRKPVKAKKPPHLRLVQ
jgi:hypothetical protein